MSKVTTIYDTLSKINEVEGFDPAELAVEYNDMNTGKSEKRLPVKAQMAWFRLKYPEGKIALSVKPAGTFFVAEAKVYSSYQDAPDNFLAEATAARGPLVDKPHVSPREWAQTAAIGVALRNAGFGLQFQAAGDSFDEPAVDELGTLVNNAPASKSIPGQPPAAEAALQTESGTMVPTTSTQIKESMPPSATQDPLEQAMAIRCPASKYKDKTLGEMISINPGIFPWIIKTYGEESEVGAAAKLICNHAVQAVG